MNSDLNRFRNVTVALNTPFKEGGSVDLDATQRLCEYFYQKGIRNLYVCGSTGEGFLLTLEERKQVAEACAAVVGPEMTLIVHVGCASTRLSCELAEHARKIGAAAISAVPCVYYRPSEESIYTHWTEITKAGNLPFFIYNIPQLTGYNLSLGLFKRMLTNPLVAGIKNSSDPVQDIMKFKQLGGPDFIVFNGPDEQYLAGRLFGADAGIGGTYGAMPELYLLMEAAICQGNIERAKAIQNVVTPLIYRLCAFPSMYGACKAILALDGCPVGQPRLPFLPVSMDDPALRQLYQDIRASVEKFRELT